MKSAVGAATLTLSALALAGCSLLTGVPEGESDVFTIKVGDCLNDLDVADGEVSSVPIVDCAEPHDTEAFARTESTSDSYPGSDALFAELDAYCQGDVFVDFVGLPYDDSRYYTTGYIPTSGSWEERGDRELLCTIGDPDGQTTGSLEGINQ